MKAIVTGATGFIGLALCRELLQNGYEVTAVIRPDTEKKDKLLDLQKENDSSGNPIKQYKQPSHRTSYLGGLLLPSGMERLRRKRPGRF